jgi:hypothetical protein
VDGNFIADHRLSDIAARMTLDEVTEKKSGIRQTPCQHFIQQ